MTSDSLKGQAIVLTVACGKPRYAKQAMALAMSARIHGTQARFVLVSDCADAEVSKWFDLVVPPVSGVEPYLQKIVGLMTTDADRVLFLDSDSLAVRNLDELLELLMGKPFAAMGDWITDGYYWGETSANLKKTGASKIARINGGLLYYERSPDGEAVISRSLEVSRDFDRLGLDRLAGKIHDEGCVSPALSTTQLGELIPDTHGYSLTPWTSSETHLDVLRGECHMVNGYRKHVQAVRPYIYHSAMTGWDMRYWRQVKRLLTAVQTAQGLKLESGKPMSLMGRVSRKLGEAWARIYKKIHLRDF